MLGLQGIPEILVLRLWSLYKERGLN